MLITWDKAMQSRLVKSYSYHVPVWFPASQAGTELGRSTAIMNIERVRNQLPIRLSVEQRQANVEELPGSIAEIRWNLANRKGFLIEGESRKTGDFHEGARELLPPDNPGGTTKETPATGKRELEGEIDLIFIPQWRDWRIAGSSSPRILPTILPVFPRIIILLFYHQGVELYFIILPPCLLWSFLHFRALLELL